MAYNKTFKQSPNYWKGRSQAIKAIAIHWWGDPKTKPTLAGVVNVLSTPSRQASAHYVASGTNRQVTQLVREEDTSWATGSANPFTISIECDPRCRASDYDVVAELIADIWKRHGRLPLHPHNKYMATQCPGNYDLKKLETLAVKKFNAGKQAAKPTYVVKDITDKFIISKTGKNVNAYNLDAKTWGDLGKNPVSIDGRKQHKVVAIAEHVLGGKYYLTAYSAKAKVKHGINVVDVKDYIPKNPTVTQPAPPEPKPTDPTPPEVSGTENGEDRKGEFGERVDRLEYNQNVIISMLSSIFGYIGSALQKLRR